MIDHDTLVRRVNDVMDDILQGEHGPQDVDMTGIKVETSRDPDDGTERYPVVMRCEDESLAAIICVASSISAGQLVANQVRIIINQWLDNDIARGMQ